MKRLAFLIAVLCLLSFSYGQTTIDLTFTAIDGADYTQLDSLKVMNRTQGGDTVLYYPDTVLSFVVTGMNEVLEAVSGFQLFQNYPNPVKDRTSITLQVPESGAVKLSVTDILGRVVLSTDQDLKKDSHTFSFTPGNGEIYFFTARFKNENQSIKIICSPIKSGSKASLIYTGTAKERASIKSTASLQTFFFNYGDELLYIGYYDTLQSGMLNSPEESDTYIFQFAYDIPCPGTPTVEYEGQVYNTVQIMSQCWLKENLNVGTMIDSNDEMKDNGILEKYCYNNEPDSCLKYGGMYQWDEMMQYTTMEGVQGICPPGWHIPSDEEAKVLEGVVDSQYPVGDSEWDIPWMNRGYNAGTNLKSTSGWFGGGNGTDLFGFSGLPSGYYNPNGFFSIRVYGFFWTTTQDYTDRPWDRGLDYSSPGVHRDDDPKEGGLSVRCVKDE